MNHIEIVRANHARRAAIQGELRAIDEAATADNRDYTDDERAIITDRRSELEAIDNRIATNLDMEIRSQQIDNGITSLLGSMLERQDGEMVDTRSLGRQFVDMDEVRSWVDQGARGASPALHAALDLRAVTDVTTGATSAGALIQNDRLGRIGNDFLDRRTFLIDLLPTINVSTGAVEVVQDQSPLADLANKAVLDSLLAGNKKVLEDIPYWIVDFRDNGGGSTDVFQSLLPYLYTQPFKEYGVSHWLSPDNTAVLKDFLVENEKMMDAGSARSIRALVKQGEARPNTWHIGQGETTRLNKHEMPRRVAILANSGTASSGEAFLEVARGISAKSVIFGENTGGFMDYGDVMPHDLHCDGLIAAIPTSRMNRIDHGLSYDKDGIAPDVRIGPTEPDWITFVQHYWGRP